MPEEGAGFFVFADQPCISYTDAVDVTLSAPMASLQIKKFRVCITLSQICDPRPLPDNSTPK
jgi:hypothetical protein